MARNLESPPSAVTGALGSWLRELHSFIEARPNFSYASFAVTETPNSRVTGLPGDLCINIGSASTVSRLWLLGGTVPSSRTDQGWALVRIVQV